MRRIKEQVRGWGQWLKFAIFFILSAIFLKIVSADNGIVYKLHAVQQGETLKSVALRYGITVEQLRSANSSLGFPDDEPLPEGKILVVPTHGVGSDVGNGGSSPNSLDKMEVNAFWVYEAKGGETLESIAKNFKIPIKMLYEANRHFKAGEALRAGVTVLIPIVIDRADGDQKNQNSQLPRQEHLGMPFSNSGAKVTDVGVALNVNYPQYNRELSRSANLRALSQNLAIVGVVKIRSTIYSSPTKNSTRYYTCQPGRKLVIVGRKNGWLGVLMINGAIGWIQENAVTLTNETVTLPATKWALSNNITRLVSYNPLGHAIVNEAMRYLNVPYKYGGNSMNGIDCSALVQKVYAAFGIKLPRTATEQLRHGVPVDLSQIQPGDRVYFSNNGIRANHCGIYIGDGKFIHASGRHGKVTISSLFEPRYFNTLFCVLR